MKKKEFEKRVKKLFEKHEKLINRPNPKLKEGPGIYDRYKYPILTDQHTPIFWRYDLDQKTNPFLMERMGINAAFNAGAIELDDKIFLVARVEGWDRKSFFAVAESKSGTEKFRFWDYPVEMPVTDDPETNVYDIRLTQHEDGWIYGLFCAERKDKENMDDLSAAVASCGIARTKDLKTWDRLPDLVTKSPQQRNVVLHPEFIDGKYGFYTRPLATFAATGTGKGIGWGLADDITKPKIDEEIIFEKNVYHTIKEGKNGQGPAPVKTEVGWLHLAHGVRDTAAGMRYVLYAFITDLNDPTKIIYQPGGYLLAPQGEERVGDVSNVLFANGWVARKNGDLLIYYASSDTRMHVAKTTVEKLVDYCMHTPEDGLKSYACVKQRAALISKNLKILKKN